MWGKLRFPFVADYRYYKKHGLIVFPQDTDKKRRWMSIILTGLSHIPSVRKKIYGQMMKHEMMREIAQAAEKY